MTLDVAAEPSSADAETIARLTDALGVEYALAWYRLKACNRRARASGATADLDASFAALDVLIELMPEGRR